MLILYQKLSRDINNDIKLYLVQKGLLYGVLFLFMENVYGFALLVANIGVLVLQNLVITSTFIIIYLINKRGELSRSLAKYEVQPSYELFTGQPSSFSVPHYPNVLTALAKGLLDSGLIVIFVTSMELCENQFYFLFGCGCAIIDKIQTSYLCITKYWLHILNLGFLLADIILVSLIKSDDNAMTIKDHIYLLIVVNPHQLFFLFFLILASLALNYIVLANFRTFSQKFILKESTFEHVQCKAPLSSILP